MIDTFRNALVRNLAIAAILISVDYMTAHTEMQFMIGHVVTVLLIVICVLEALAELECKRQRGQRLYDEAVRTQLRDNAPVQHYPKRAAFERAADVEDVATIRFIGRTPGQRINTHA